MKIEKNIAFEESDALLLQAMGMACGSSSASLTGILQMSETIGGHRLTFQELDGGLARLGVAGLIKFDGHDVTPARETLTFLEQAHAKSGSLDELHSMVWNQLCRSCPGEPIRRASWTTRLLTQEEFEML